MSLPLSQGRRGGSTAFIEVAPEAGWERWLEHHADGNLIAGIRRIAHPFHLISTCLLEEPYGHFNISADLPFVNVRDSKLVVKEIGADEGDLGLLRFIKKRTIDQLLN